MAEGMARGEAVRVLEDELLELYRKARRAACLVEALNRGVFECGAPRADGEFFREFCAAGILTEIAGETVEDMLIALDALLEAAPC